MQRERNTALNIIPFVWFHGESIETMLEEIRQVRASGLEAFCVESRPFPDFCGESWWKMMDAVLAEAKSLGMKVWLLDDKIYPTGYANGGIYRDKPELRQWHLRLDAVDAVGPQRNARFLLPPDDESVLLGAFAFRRAGNGIDYASAVDLTARVSAPYVTYDVPEGYHQIVFLSKTQKGCERPYYIDMLNPASVDVLIENVYEPHARRYAEKYAGTFCGFFSDEPRFANARVDETMPEICSHECTLGVDGMSYPWSDRIGRKLVEEGFALSDLIGIWRDIGPKTARLRCRYMNLITDDYAEFFTGRLSRWCHERGLTYCGHIIEDSGAHARLNCSSGHYFKSMAGGDFACVDVVLHQIKPFFTQIRHFAHISSGYSEPDFFQYTLAKLASSCARTDETKQGRALCEIFGAYGWGESMTAMLYLTNHMLSRGINTFIPHAFSPKFPDEDCPPHFYARGHYPARKGFRKLMEYMDSMCSFFKKSKVDCPVAVLYHAEAEWSGRPYTTTDKVARTLAEHQIDFDILSPETLAAARADGNQMCAGLGRWRLLVVPYCEYLPEETIRLLREWKRTAEVCVAGSVSPAWNDFLPLAGEDLPARAYACGAAAFRAESFDPDLRVEAGKSAAVRWLFAVNESAQESENRLLGDFPETVTCLDVLNGRIWQQSAASGLSLRLRRGEARLIVLGAMTAEEAEGAFGRPFAPPVREGRGIPLRPSVMRLYPHDGAESERTLSEFPADVNALPGLGRFSGKAVFPLALPAEGGVVKVCFEGEQCVFRCAGQEEVSIQSPAYFRVPRGADAAEMEICNTLAISMADFFSKFAAIEPFGILSAERMEEE